MKRLDWLRKVGILRCGAEASVYHDATQRPASLQADGVYDSEKDVIDLDKRPGRDAEPGRDESSSGHRPG